MPEELALYLRFALDWIDAIPKEIADSLPAMPGFDRDAAEVAICGATRPVATFISSTPHIQYIDGYKPKTGDSLYLIRKGKTKP